MSTSKPFFLLLCISAVFCIPVSADPLTDLIESASAESGVPASVIRAVCTHESQSFHNGKRQPWPWTLNVSGKGYWFKNKASAISVAKLSIGNGINNIDVGICQINWYWHRHNFADVTQLLSPKINIHYAASYLASLKRGTESWETVVGRYHNPSNRQLAQQYSLRVLGYQ